MYVPEVVIIWDEDGDITLVEVGIGTVNVLFGSPRKSEEINASIKTLLYT